METKTQNDFSKGSVAGLIIKQALPLAVSQLVQLLYNIVDRIYIGHIPGEDLTPLTGLGLTLPIVSIILAFTLLLGQGGAPHFSIYRGKGDTKTASKLLGNAFTLLLIGGIVLTISCYFFMKPLLFALGASEASYVYAKDYLSIYLIGTTFQMVATGLNFFIPAEGFPKTAMFTIMSGTALNLILDPVFIFGLNLGIKGAAIATVISQLATLILVVHFLTLGKAIIKLNLADMKLNPSIVAKIITMGLTGFVMEITNSATQVVCNRTLKAYSGDQSDLFITIMTIVNSVRAMMGVAVTGITSGAQPVLGFNYGAKKYDRVKSGIRWSFVFAFSYTAVAWLIVFLFPRFFIGLFSSDMEAVNIAVPYLHLFFMAYVFMSLQFSGQLTFMALGKAKQAIFFSLFRKAILVIPLTIILPMFMSDPIKGVFAAEPISNVIGGAASFFTMFFTIYLTLGKDIKDQV